MLDIVNNKNKLDTDNEISIEYQNELTKNSVILYLDLMQPSLPFLQQFRKNFFRNLIKSGIVLVALNAGWPYYKPAKEFFRNNPFLREYAGISELIALGSVSAWSVLDYDNYLQLKKYASRSNLCFEVGCLVSSLFFGIVSALPGAIITVKYNKNYGFLALSLFLDITTNTAALNRLFREVIISVRYVKKNSLRRLLNSFLTRLKLSQDTTEIYLKNEYNEQSEILPALMQLIASTKKAVNKRLNHLICYGPSRKIFINTLAALLPAPWEVTAGYLVYEELIKFTSSPFLSILLTLFAVIPTYVLEFTFANYLFDNIYTGIANRIFRSSDTQSVGYHSKYSKKCASIGITSIIAMLLVSLSFSARAQIVEDTFSDSTFRTILLTLTILGTLVFKFTPIIGNITDIFSFFSTPDNSDLQSQFTDDLSIVLNNSNPQSTDEFMSDLPFDTEDLDNEIIENHEQFTSNKQIFSSGNSWGNFFSSMKSPSNNVPNSLTLYNDPQSTPIEYVDQSALFISKSFNN